MPADRQDETIPVSGWFAVKRGISAHPIFRRHPERLAIWMWLLDNGGTAVATVDSISQHTGLHPRRVAAAVKALVAKEIITIGGSGAARTLSACDDLHDGDEWTTVVSPGGATGAGKWRGGALPTPLRRAVIARDGGRCQYCGVTPATPHVDHVLPVALGGQDTIDNLRTACPPCNLSKGAKSLTKWSRK